jgi:GDP-4-dehydro-6-deoxy-D-mannose reductase
MTRYLVTGAQGFIGRHMVSHLLHCSPESIVLGIGRSPQQDSFFNYSLSCGDRRALAALPEYLRPAAVARYRYDSVDMTSVDFARAVVDFRPTKVIHLAAMLRGAPDELIFENNVRSTVSLLDAISQCDVELFLFASSGGVYGKQDILPIDETAIPLALDPYSRSKLAAEELVRQFAIRSGIRIAIARIFNVLGPGQDDLHFAGRIAAQIASILAGKADPIVRTGPLSSSRDFVDVRDVCHGLWAILESHQQEVYNLGSGLETTVGELLELFFAATGLRMSVRIESESTRIEPIPRHVANIGRIASEGFLPQYKLDLCCREMLAYCARHVCDCSQE